MNDKIVKFKEIINNESDFKVKEIPNLNLLEVRIESKEQDLKYVQLINYNELEMFDTEIFAINLINNLRYKLSKAILNKKFGKGER